MADLTKFNQQQLKTHGRMTPLSSKRCPLHLCGHPLSDFSIHVDRRCAVWQLSCISDLCPRTWTTTEWARFLTFSFSPPQITRPYLHRESASVHLLWLGRDVFNWSVFGRVGALLTQGFSEMLLHARSAIEHANIRINTTWVLRISIPNIFIRELISLVPSKIIHEPNNEHARVLS